MCAVTRERPAFAFGDMLHAAAELVVVREVDGA